MKKIPLVLAAFLCTQHVQLQAQNETPGVLIGKSSQPPALSKEEEFIYNEIANISAIAVGCELNEACIYSMLTDFMKKSPTAALQIYLKILENNKQQIDTDAMNCNTEQIQQFKKEIAPCINIGLDDKKTILTMNDEQIKNTVEVCMIEKSEKAANENNLYGIAITATLAMENNDQTKYKYWYGKLRLQRDSSEVITVQKCEKSILAPVERLEEAVKSTLRYYLLKYKNK